jgi:hypothetical protein
MSWNSGPSWPSQGHNEALAEQIAAEAGQFLDQVTEPPTSQTPQPLDPVDELPPRIPGYLVWRVGPAWHARSNIHDTPGAAQAAGVRWFASAWTAADLVEQIHRPLRPGGDGAP